MTILQYIEKNLPLTIRENKEDRDPLLGLPYPYIIPCACDMFQEMYYWDTYFANKGLILRGDIQQAKNNVDNLRSLLERFGFVLNGNNKWFCNNSQPPFLALMVRDIYEATKDRKWLKDAYVSVRKEHNFWQERRMTQCGLNRYDCEPLPESWIPGAVAGMVQRLGYRPDKTDAELARGMYAAGESGWDCTPRFTCETYCYAAVDLNSLLYAQEAQLAFMASELELPEEMDAWVAAKEKRTQKMRQYLKGEDGIFNDYNTQTGKHSTLASTACFYPLFVKMATQEEAAATVKLLGRLEKDHGLAVCEESDVPGNFQWGYPNGWSPMHYITVMGLLNYGYRKEALRIAGKYVKLVESCFKKTGHLWEKYNVVEGNVQVLDEYKMPAMLGWTFGVYVFFQMLLEKSKNEEKEL